MSCISMTIMHCIYDSNKSICYVVKTHGFIHMTSHFSPSHKGLHKRLKRRKFAYLQKLEFFRCLSQWIYHNLIIFKDWKRNSNQSSKIQLKPQQGERKRINTLRKLLMKMWGNYFPPIWLLSFTESEIWLLYWNTCKNSICLNISR